MRSREDFVALSLELPTCGRFKQCWRTMGIAAPSFLIVEDSEGKEQFRLQEPEYDAVMEVVGLPDFQRAMNDRQAWTCPVEGDKESTVVVEWKDGEEQSAIVVDECFGSPDDPLAIYAVLRNRLVEFKRKYLNCPPIFALPPDIDPETDPPPVRPLCFACFGQC